MLKEGATISIFIVPPCLLESPGTVPSAGDAGAVGFGVVDDGAVAVVAGVVPLQAISIRVMHNKPMERLTTLTILLFLINAPCSFRTNNYNIYKLAAKMRIIHS